LMIMMMVLAWVALGDEPIFILMRNFNRCRLISIY
jgi:hypothetical protein